VLQQEVLSDIGNGLGRLLGSASHQDHGEQKTTAGDEEEIEGDEDEQYFVCHDSRF
jgi:hypothetical protein